MNPDNHTNPFDLTEAETAALADPTDADAGAAAEQAQQTAQADADRIAAEQAAASAAAATPSATDEAALRMAEAATRLASAADALATRAEPAQQAQTDAEQAPRDFDAEFAKLQQDFEDDEIDQAEYNRRDRELLREQTRAETLAAVREERRASDEAARAKAAQDADASWNAATERFFSDPANAKLVQDPIGQAAFNAAVGVAYKDGGQSLSFDELLVAARALIPGAAPIPSADAQAKALRDAEFNRQKQAGANAPVTLRDVPQSASTDTDPGVALDNLPIDKLEDALARMSDTDRERYLSSAPGGLRDNPHQYDA